MASSMSSALFLSRRCAIAHMVLQSGDDTWAALVMGNVCRQVCSDDSTLEVGGGEDLQQQAHPSLPKPVSTCGRIQ